MWGGIFLLVVFASVLRLMGRARKGVQQQSDRVVAAASAYRSPSVIHHQ